MSATTVDRETTLAQRQAAGLRAMADFIEQNPEFADGFRTSFASPGIMAHPRFDDRAADLAAYARAAARFGAKVTKKIDDDWHNLVLDFGGVKAEVLAYREQVCERVITGVETVVKRVKDPEALAAVPEVEVTEEVETYRWECKPLLDAGVDR